MTIRRATREDGPTLQAIAAESPGLTFPADVLSWPTVECYIVESEGEILGFGYLEAIPEAHFVTRRRGLKAREKSRVLECLHVAAEAVLERLDLPAIRFPVRSDVPALAISISRLRNVQGDPRVHLALVRGGS